MVSYLSFKRCVTQKHWVFLILVALLSLKVDGQPVYNALSFKAINSERYIRLTYENDYFVSADWYYSQGMLFEMVSPVVRKFPVTKLLLHPHYASTRYGLSVEHDIYTPMNIDRTEVRPGDRPYAGCLLLNTFLITIDPVKRQRFAGTFSLGVIGPAAGAIDLQREVHKLLPHNSIPVGWINQVQNDAVLNYQVSYERQVLSLNRFLSFDVGGMVRAGTLFDKASIGATAILGYFDSPYGNATAAKGKVRMYAYEHPEVTLVGYDATLQGGIFNNTTPYTIASDDICRFTFQNRFGLVVIINRVNLEFFRTFLSREYEMGLTHAWGGIQITYKL